MSEAPRPRISVVIPCFNQASYLDDAVSSCVEAYEGPLEIVVVDDGSTDPRTGDHIAALRVPARVELRIVRQPNGGLAHARNVGLRHATGDYVQFLDSDDLLVRNKIEHQLRHLELDPGLDVSVGDYFLSDGARAEVTAPPSSIARFSLSLEDFLFHWERGFSVPIHAALFRRRVFVDPVAFIETQRAKEDWLFWVSLKLRGVRLGYLPLRLCVYRMHGSNMTGATARMGIEWIKAASRIDGWLAGRHPDFLQASIRWYVDWYVTRGRTEAAAPAPAPVPAVVATAHEEPGPPVAPRAIADVISVVIPVYNHAAYLRRCVRSAHDQTVRPREIVCVDDASPDPEVRRVLEALAAEIPELKVRFLERNVGISAAQNLAVELATGEFIAFLDCDDFLAPNAIELAGRQLRARPDVDYLFTDRQDVDDAGRPLRRAVYGGYPNRPDLDRVSHYENLLDAMVASHLKVVRRSKILEVGGFDPRTSGVQDWDLALKVAEAGTLHYIPEAPYHHRIHRRSVTLGQRALMFRRTNEVRRRHQGVRVQRDAERVPGVAALDGVAALVVGAVPEATDCGVFRWDARTLAWCDAEREIAVVRRPRAPREAFRLWSSSRITCFALESGASAETLAFLREFNSYFDVVVCADEAQWVALHGYMWDSRALRLIDELPRSGSAAGQGAEAVPVPAEPVNLRTARTCW